MATTLTANWANTPIDVVLIILKLVEKHNYKFHVNRILRIDSIPHYDQEAKMCIRLRSTPPISFNKYISRGILNHYERLTLNLIELKYTLTKRKIISGDSNIKPSKLKYKYCKQVQERNQKYALYR